MPRTLLLLAAALCAAAVLPAEPQRCHGAGPPAAEKKIEAALGMPTQLEFIKTPLQDVIDYLKDYHRIEIQIDEKAFEDAGLDESKTPITKNHKRISLRSALNLTLGDLELTYLIQDEVLLITSEEEAQSFKYMSTKVYRVDDLIARYEPKPDEEVRGALVDYDTMMHMITSTVEPARWAEVGGPGSIVGATFNDVETLVILQTYHVHRKIAVLLEELRNVAGGKKPPPAKRPKKAAAATPAKPPREPAGDPFGSDPAAEPAPKRSASYGDDPFGR